jgi:hypothetical protein
MKFSVAVLTAVSLSAASAFQPTAFTRTSSGTALFGLDLSGNNWKPDSDKMGSTDVGDYFPEGYDKNEVDFSEGMMGSQDTGNKDHGPARPGLDDPGTSLLRIVLPHTATLREVSERLCVSSQYHR